MALHVAVLVPLRQQSEFPRLAHLDRLVRPCAFLPRACHSQAAVDYTVVVAEEEDTATRRFNRGALLNLAFHLCPRPVDMVIFHDVDLLPSDDLASHYAVPLPPGAARHLGARWGRYAAANPRYLGGVVAMHPADVKRIDGFPATFWGWGARTTPCACAWRRRGSASRCPRAGTTWTWRRWTWPPSCSSCATQAPNVPINGNSSSGNAARAPACATRGAPTACARASAAPRPTWACTTMNRVDDARVRARRFVPCNGRL